ncbi:protein PSK SIMULATOR 1-like [Oryza brachyantha]|uniref:protein PSK SIMULATOR 1-like n=1 Tax=Oryza brachyantha TaxID=4533 RepID=UPI001ADC3CA9|nr:protein PSK SIMULATOR 1-like [Oryza brachyantha]
MGGVCSAGIPGDRSPAELSFRAMGLVMEQELKAFPVAGKVQGKNRTAPVEEAAEPEGGGDQPHRLSPVKSPRLSTGAAKARRSVSKEPQLARSSSEKLKSGKSRTSTSGKASDIGSVFGRASTSGIGKAVEVLDTLSSSMTSFSPGGGFVSGAKAKGSLEIVAFEVANTIVKGMSLMQSLSKESMRFLKGTVLRSEGVKRLVSSDMNELMRIAAADKRQELTLFSREVIRFGNRCKNPQWHNLDRYFSKLESEITPQPDLKEIAEAEMQQLMNLVRLTADLYHELHALDRFEQDYRRKLEEEKKSVGFERGDTVQIIKQELKSQRKHVQNLKKKSLWNKMLDDVMEKLVDIVHFLHVEIQESFGSYDIAAQSNESSESRQTLGSAGLSLHYANIISQIDNIVSRSTVPPQSTRDALYQGLPPTIKSALRTKLLNSPESQEVPIIEIRSSMEKTLQWIIPIASNTARAHHGFGWVGEWANTGSDVMRRAPGQPDVLKIETFYHADKEKTEACILDLVVWLHHLISYSRPSTGARSRSPSRSPVRSPPLTPPQQLMTPSSPPPPARPSDLSLTREDRAMLQDVYASRRRRAPGHSRSQELSSNRGGGGGRDGSSAAQLSKNDRLSKSSSDAPARATAAGGGGGGGKLFPLTRRPSSALVSPAVDFDIDGIKALDGQKRQ